MKNLNKINFLCMITNKESISLNSENLWDNISELYSCRLLFVAFENIIVK